jgi:hypothetical protein
MHGAAEVIERRKVGQQAFTLFPHLALAEQQAGFLEQLADRGDAERAGEGGGGAVREQAQRLRLQLRHHAYPVVAAVDAAAREDQHARHEFVFGVPHAHQDLGLARRSPWPLPPDDEAGGVAWRDGALARRRDQVTGAAGIVGRGVSQG